MKSGAIGMLKVALVILLGGFIIHLCAPKVGDPGRSPNYDGKRRITAIEGALELFRFDVGRYPSTKEGLAVLVRNPGDLDRWRGPYLKTDYVPDDPWKRPYIYRCPGKSADFDLLSFGRDGKEGGTGEDQDITK